MAAINLADWIRDKFYRVGTYYISSNGTSPASLWGGSWTQIGAGTFITAAGSGYTVNSGGGAATVALGHDQVPGSLWSASARNRSGEIKALFSQGASYGINSVPGAASYAHENRPPYIAAYIWRRTG